MLRCSMWATLGISPFQVKRVTGGTQVVDGRYPNICDRLKITKPRGELITISLQCPVGRHSFGAPAISVVSLAPLLQARGRCACLAQLWSLLFRSRQDG